MSESKDPIPQDIKELIEKAAHAEEIYEPKYGGKDRSGYGTMMKYEINSERSECFEKGAIFGYQLRIKELEALVTTAKLALKEIYTGSDFPLSIAQNALRLIDNGSKQ